MHRSVVRLRPRVRPFEDAVAAYRSADFEGALAALHGRFEPAAVALRGRTLLRLGRIAEAAEFFESEDVSLGEHRRRGELLVLRAAVLTRLDAELARIALDEARVHVISAVTAGLEAEYHYYDAVWHFAIDDLDGAECCARRSMHVVPAICEGPSDYFVPLLTTQARALDALAVAAAARGRYRDQLGYAREAIRVFDRAASSDVYQEAGHMRNLAVLVRDFDLPGDAAMLRTRSQALAWTPATGRFRYQITEALGWCNALGGNHVGAFGDFRVAAELAPTVPLRIYALIAHAFLATELDHHLVALDEVMHAEALCAGVDWDRAADDERLALLSVAQAVAAISPERARRLLDRYRAIRSKMPSAMAARLEARIRADEHWTEGLVARAEGRRDLAVRHLIDAFELLEPIGYAWRAALVAAALAELTDEERFAEFARREAAARPGAWFARKLGRAAGRAAED